MKIKVLHITPHLGGGVGRVLSRVALYRKENSPDIEDSFVCLEQSEKNKITDDMINAGINILHYPDNIDKLISEADIVQIEWWHHPLMVKFLSEREITARIVMWCHTSGLCYPKIQRELVDLPHAFLFTTPVSLDLFRGVSIKRTVGVVNSSGGFDDIPDVVRKNRLFQTKYAYVGTTLPSKLHPKISEILDTVKDPNFIVHFYGDKPKSRRLLKSKKIKLHGFIDNLNEALLETDVLVYLLNPTHYGTTENALLEAMALGVVPVVLNNRVESSIVEDGVTGFVVSSVKEFVSVIKRLNSNPSERLRISAEASNRVREKYSLENTISGLDKHYHRVISQRKRTFNFDAIFGNSPGQWFASSMGIMMELFRESSDARKEYPVLYEQSKGSAFQFLRYFPKDKDIKYFTDVLEKDIRE